MLFTNVKRKAEEGLSRERIEYRETLSGNAKQRGNAA